MMWTDKNLSSIDFTAQRSSLRLYHISDFMEKDIVKVKNFLDFNGTVQLEIKKSVQSPKKKVVYYTSSLDEICIFILNLPIVSN